MLDVGDFRLTQTVTQTGQKRDGRNRKIPVNTEFFHLKYVHIIIKIQKNTNGWLLTCMGSQVRVLYCPPSSCTQIDAAAKSPEVSTTSGFFCAQFLKSEKKISKRVLAKSVDLNLYARDFGPLFREFFGEAALFYSRQNVEFEQVFCWCCWMDIPSVCAIVLTRAKPKIH